MRRTIGKWLPPKQELRVPVTLADHLKSKRAKKELLRWRPRGFIMQHDNGGPCFSCSPPTKFPYFGTLWQKTMTLGRKDKAFDYLRPCSQRLSTFSIWYWGEPAIKHRPKLSKRWKKHTLIYQTGINKIRREIKARKHLVSSDFDWETNSIWLNQKKEQVAHDLNDQVMKSSFVDLKLKWRREWSWKSSWLLWISCSCVLTWSHLC